MRLGSKPPGGQLRLLFMIGVPAAAGFALLYAAHLFYLQFLLVIWGGVVVAGITAYEKRPRDARPTISLGDADALASQQETLAKIDERLSKPTGAGEERFLRARRAEVEQEVRKLRWSLKESGLESIRRATGQKGLEPLPPREAFLQRRRRAKQEQAHLLDSLGEAEEVLATEPSESAHARLDLIAADVKAHYYLLKGLESGSRSLGDYAAAWAVLASISKGVRLDLGFGSRASRKVKARLEMLNDSAVETGVVPRGREGHDDFDEESERWK